ncbi:hypothetical protein MBLNU459_g1834t1 [Dothideomycetes sp. NU459]
MALATGALAASTAAVAAYLDAKFHIQKDIRSIWEARRAQQDWAAAAKAGRVSLWYRFEEQFLLSNGVQPGELVATYLQNSPEFMFVMLASWAVGTAPAMANYNLAGEGLLHCLKISGSKVVLVDEDVECQARIEEVRERIEGELGMKILILDERTKHEISSTEPIRPGREYRKGMKMEFPMCLIYTSGTTGLPKGCSFPIQRAWAIGDHRQRGIGVSSGPNGDRWYDCTTLCIGKKFSTSRFWDDVRDSRATTFVYVGEAARYLLSAPSSPNDKVHNIRTMYGNGLRPDVWKKFQARFGIESVLEFFNSTEGVFSLHTFSRNDYFAEAVGHHGGILRLMYKDLYVPVQIDYETGDIWRDAKTGFAKRVPYEEGGECIVKVPDEAVFPGYWNAPEATAKKFVRNVFKEDDLYYRSGDALRRTPDGHWFFMDRLGDTFRWKGENCSTAEVGECLGKFPGIQEANVYGIELPAHDGRAGCAAISIAPSERDKFDFRGLLLHSQNALPRYAVPIFLRLVEEMGPTMHNNKQNKVQLRREGVDPEKIANGQAGRKDVIFWLPPKGDTYEQFGEAEWHALVAGKARL